MNNTTKQLTGCPWVEPGSFGPNRKCDQFTWFDAVFDESYILPVKHNFSQNTGYHSADYSSIFSKRVQKNNACDVIDKRRYHYTESYKPSKSGGYDVHGQTTAKVSTFKTNRLL